MRALVWHGKEDIRCDTVPDPKIEHPRDAIYVLTKTISRIYKGGEAGEALDHEVMSFTSSEIGRFKKGTSCVATGKLEDLPTQALKKVSAQPSG